MAKPLELHPLHDPVAQSWSGQKTAQDLKDMVEHARPTIALVDDASLDVNSYKIRVKDGGITTAKLADNAVVNSKIVDGAVSTSKISDGAITLNKIDPAIKTRIEMPILNTSSNITWSGWSSGPAVADIPRMFDGDLSTFATFQRASFSPGGGAELWIRVDLGQFYLVSVMIDALITASVSGSVSFAMRLYNTYGSTGAYDSWNRVSYTLSSQTDGPVIFGDVQYGNAPALVILLTGSGSVSITLKVREFVVRRLL